MGKCYRCISMHLAALPFEIFTIDSKGISIYNFKKIRTVYLEIK